MDLPLMEEGGDLLIREKFEHENSKSLLGKLTKDCDDDKRRRTRI